jgi:hypothetical protein
LIDWRMVQMERLKSLESSRFDDGGHEDEEEYEDEET